MKSKQPLWCIWTVAIVALALVVSCGNDNSSVQLTGPESETLSAGPLTKPAAKMASGYERQAVVMATVTQSGTPVEGAEVAFARSISGRAPDYLWSGTTGADGKATIEITADAPQFWRTGASGYYQARATDTAGDVLGTWTSIPINGGRGNIFSLPIGKQARTKKGVLMVDEITSSSLQGNPMENSTARKMTIYLPPGYDDSGKQYPVIYLLHGFTGDYKTWTCSENRGFYWPPVNDFPRQNLNGMLDDMIASGQFVETIVVMPDGGSKYGGGFYTNSVLNGDYEDYIVKDVVQHVDSHYRTLASRDSRAIAGHSMGGYGAMRLAMRNADVFCAVASHGAPLYAAAMQPMIPMVIAENPDGLIGPSPERPLTTLTYAIAAAWSPNLETPPYYVDMPFDYATGEAVDAVWERWFRNDPFTMLNTYGTNLASLKGIWIDAGDQDEFGTNFQIDAFHQALQAAGIPHEFEIYAGGHYNRVFEKLSASLSYISSFLVAGN